MVTHRLVRSELWCQFGALMHSLLGLCQAAPPLVGFRKHEPLGRGTPA